MLSVHVKIFADTQLTVLIQSYVNTDYVSENGTDTIICGSQQYPCYVNIHAQSFNMVSSMPFVINGTSL